MLVKLTQFIIMAFMLLCAYSFVIYLPVMVYDNIQCLKKGYDQSRTTLFLQGYCIRDFGTKVIRRR